MRTSLREHFHPWFLFFLYTKTSCSGVYRVEQNLMALNQDKDENAFTVVIATFSCLICLLIVFWTTRPMVYVLHNPWKERLLDPLLTLVPMAFTFLILYHSAWHREWPVLKRILLSILAACLIFGFNVLLLAAVAMIGALNTRFSAGH
jgi:hypothetical protein